MEIEVLTLFPEMFEGVLQSSILKRALDQGFVRISVRNIRDYTTDKHHVADDAPYGGGPGMVMKVEPIAAAIEDAVARHAPTPMLRVYLSPDGEPWSQALAEEFSRLPGLLLLCGRYEGVDERVREHFIDREISIGDYVLTGGEIPAMVIIDSVVRLIPGVLGNQDSTRQDSFSGIGLLDCPHYTRPEEFRGWRVPEILLSGHHKKIEEWRRQQSLLRTAQRRPDLLKALWDRLEKSDIEFLKACGYPKPPDEVM
ncbi:MAG: tRNA (guanosine(37)-N1)-methyltransferase TrmD [Candidatus Hydrogenedentota bacterium]|jgi:tRNA (guanine37-N1)-methyltransferase|uniref:tRNA (guanine-N(1)-)-methyltransferase n=1 Tax=Sumerlaea chitinivorans TaxID=2250252 RepID=A0A2Z4Y5N7_SUMC1|nr:tRNA (Guanine37-N1) -methyltransferase [Candidatus Sumerlaea chitinivorans]RMH25425.1 MAG: tRNA (guanosine(37)-N1)-methyltransferase TrmD [Candidatus Hydrogenedentota bacterium]GIX44302.1 MAG: tRNA (guanine-N(1)-)-methyltransferase [Candidatus Sumerlaea sp.]